MDVRFLLVLFLLISPILSAESAQSTGGNKASSAADNDLVQLALANYRRWGVDWRKIIRPGSYERNGNYLNWSAWWSEDPATWTPMVKLDTNGIMMLTYDGGATFVYNPTTISLHALYLHSLYKRGQPLDARFKRNADFLLQMQDPDGALRYPFALTTSIPAGWVAGQAQSHAISVWTRAYKLFGDNKYLDAASKAYQFMLRDTKDGGCLHTLGDIDPSLSGYRVLTEGPFDPYEFALDGSILALLGVYDWTEFEPSAMPVFNELVNSIRAILPYYDLGSFSAYDLQYIVLGLTPVVEPSYHALNTALVWTLDSISPDPVFNQIWQKWAYEVGQPGPLPLDMQMTSNDNGQITFAFNLDEPIRIERTITLNGPAWQELLPVVTPEIVSLAIETSEPTGFFKTTRAFPIIDPNTLNGGFEIWDSSSSMISWTAVTIGGTVNQDTSEVHSGESSCRIDTTSADPAGFYQYGVIVPNAYYFLEFWAKASATANLNVYFGPGRNPVKTFTLDNNWTHYTVYDKGTSLVEALALYSATSNVSIYLDDIKLWQFGAP
jgi:hypothetical protein